MKDTIKTSFIAFNYLKWFTNEETDFIGRYVFTLPDVYSFPPEIYYIYQTQPCILQNGKLMPFLFGVSPSYPGVVFEMPRSPYAHPTIKDKLLVLDENRLFSRCLGNLGRNQGFYHIAYFTDKQTPPEFNHIFNREKMLWDFLKHLTSGLSAYQKLMKHSFKLQNKTTEEVKQRGEKIQLFLKSLPSEKSIQFLEDLNENIVDGYLQTSLNSLLELFQPYSKLGKLFTPQKASETKIFELFMSLKHEFYEEGVFTHWKELREQQALTDKCNNNNVEVYNSPLAL